MLLATVGFFMAALTSGFGLEFRRSVNSIRILGAVFG